MLGNLQNSISHSGTVASRLWGVTVSGYEKTGVIFIMTDEIVKTHEDLTILESQSILKFKRIFVVVLIAMCSAFSWVLITKLETPFRYLCVPAFLLAIAYYQFVYVRQSMEHRCKIRVTREFIRYDDGMAIYRIPMTSVSGVKDESKFYDFNGRRQKSWQHLIVITVSGAFDVKNYALNNDGSEHHVNSGMSKDVKVFNLILTHKDFLDVFSFINRLFEDNKAY